jgi:hypothetical protein
MSDNLATAPIQVRLETPTEESALFVNHVAAVFDGATYTLRFFQVLPPTVIEEPLPESIAGRHMVTLTISAGNMPAIFKVLRNLVEQGAAHELEA